MITVTKTTEMKTVKEIKVSKGLIEYKSKKIEVQVITYTYPACGRV